MGVPTRQRLRRTAEFARVRAEGRRAECGPFLLQILDRTGEALAQGRRAGVIASRRVGGAVQRNYAKRRMREVFRRNQEVLPPACDVVLVARRRIFTTPFAELERRFVLTARRLCPPPAQA